jgi:hypothetical protein
MIKFLKRLACIIWFCFKHRDGVLYVCDLNGVDGKYLVVRADGRDNTGEQYIVLRIDNGSKTATIARQASWVYISAMEKINPKAYLEMKWFMERTANDFGKENLCN